MSRVIVVEGHCLRKGCVLFLFESITNQEYDEILLSFNGENNDSLVQLRILLKYTIWGIKVLIAFPIKFYTNIRTS